MFNSLIKKYQSLTVQIKASFWFLICSFLQRGISVITTPIFTRLLTPEEFGQFSVFNSWMGIIGIFITLRLSYGVYAQGLVKFENENNLFSAALQGLSIVLVSGWTLIYLCFSRFWNSIFHLNTWQMILMLILIWTSNVFEFWASEQRVNFKYHALIIVTLMVSVAKPIMGIILIHRLEDAVLARILGLVLVEIVAFSWMALYQIYRGHVFYSKKYWKYAILFNLPLVPHYLSQTVLNNSDRIMIERMVGSREAGIYSLAYSVAMVMTLFNIALMNTMSPWIYKKIRDGRICDIAKTAYATLLLIAFVNLMLIAFAPEIITLFAPREYFEAVWIIPPVALSVYFMFAYDLFAKFEFYYEKTHYIMLGSVIGALLNIVLNYFFIPQYGYLAAGYTTLFCYIIYALFHYRFMKSVCYEKLGGISVYDAKVLLSISILFILLGSTYALMYHSLLLRICISASLLVGLSLKWKNLIFIFKNLINKERER